MLSVLTGFAVIAAGIAIGLAVGRAGFLGTEAPRVLSRLAFSVLSPLLLFQLSATAELAELLHPSLLISIAAALLAGLLFLAVAVLRSRLTRLQPPVQRGVARSTIGVLSAAYVNANYLGIPIATYVLGDAAAVVPLVLVQLLVFTPVALIVLDWSTGSASIARVALAAARNPLILGTLLGVVVNLLGIDLPPILAEPIRAISAATVPIVLLAFGMSLAATRVLTAGSGRAEIVAAVAVKTLVMPAIAYLLGLLAGLDPASLAAVTTFAALPTAQNIFLYAQRYRVAEPVARDSVLLSTVISLPVLLLIAALLAV